MKEVHMKVTQDMYQLALMATHGMSSMDLVTATFTMAGSRKDWKAIITLFEEAARDIMCQVEAISHVTIYTDDTAEASVFVLEGEGIVH
jgi:pyruvate/oxaloacetate carboxyltransferase